MIKSFKSKEAQKIFNGEYSQKIPKILHKITMRKLWMLDASTAINDLRVPPANHLEKLKGKRKGQYSIRINEKLRICFLWQGGNAYNVEIVDYH